MRISDWSSDVCSSDLKHRVVIGKDTRLSGYMIENALVAGFTSVGIVDRQHRAVERNAGEQPARARPGPDLGLELAVGGQRRAAPDRPCGHARIGTKGALAVDDRFEAAVVAEIGRAHV